MMYMLPIVRRIAVLAMAAAAFHVAAQEKQAEITLVGNGDQPVQVRAEGKVTETIGQSQLQLNTIPADVARREANIRQRRQERAKAIAERRRQQREEEAERAVQAAADRDTPAGETGEAPAAAAQEKQNATPKPPAVRGESNRGPQIYAREPVDPQLREPENTGVKYVWPPPRPQTP